MRMSQKRSRTRSQSSRCDHISDEQRTVLKETGWQDSESADDYEDAPQQFEQLEWSELKAIIPDLVLKRQVVLIRPYDNDTHAYTHLCITVWF